MDQSRPSFTSADIYQRGAGNYVTPTQSASSPMLVALNPTYWWVALFGILVLAGVIYHMAPER
jgi:hypothetical protein